MQSHGVSLVSGRNQSARHGLTLDLDQAMETDHLIPAALGSYHRDRVIDAMVTPPSTNLVIPRSDLWLLARRGGQVRRARTACIVCAKQPCSPRNFLRFTIQWHGWPQIRDLFEAGRHPESGYNHLMWQDEAAAQNQAVHQPVGPKQCGVQCLESKIEGGGVPRAAGSGRNVKKEDGPVANLVAFCGDKLILFRMTRMERKEICEKRGLAAPVKGGDAVKMKR
ncbi:hypothetical protein K504DRAFT_450646 [Pleomassaria siparia CBS 279.74]|uniref:Uncharacterized protein n=1 Tax=Pleomassaria siparia CBS 279.74 TaxID=1314801 RepID=A0A6G1KNI9_9PLEO|nr:hypothetical protein K504DRAFT_450646 [Pleomassaria siparia CBS 279.74]